MAQKHKHNIDDTQHPDYLHSPAVGEELVASHPSFQNGMRMAAEGRLKFHAVSVTRTASNPDGSATDRIVLDRTYTPKS